MNSPALRSEKAELYCCGPSFYAKSTTKYWWRMLKTRNLEPKNWSLFDIVGTYSIGTNWTITNGDYSNNNNKQQTNKPPCTTEPPQSTDGIGDAPFTVQHSIHGPSCLTGKSRILASTVAWDTSCYGFKICGVIIKTFFNWTSSNTF